MTSLITTASAATRSEYSTVSLAFEPSRKVWTAAAFMRIEGGVFFLESPFGPQKPDLQMIFMNSFARGLWSPRPYQLGQKTDPSVNNCVLALFYDWCNARGLNASGLMHVAYPEAGAGYSDADFMEIATQASWENYSLPDEWEASALAALFKALDEIDCTRLRAVIESVVKLPQS